MTEEHRKTKKCPFCGEVILYEAIKCRFCGEFLNKDNLNDTDTNENRIKIIGLCIGLPRELPELKERLSHYCSDNNLILLDTILPTDIDRYLAIHPEIEGLFLWDFNSLSNSTKEYWIRLSQRQKKDLFTNGVIDPDFAATPLTPREYVFSLSGLSHSELIWDDGKPKCPVCGSMSFSERKKFGIGKALVGAAVAGPVGLFAGVLGKRGVIMTCLGCSLTFPHT
jgi:predicted RNA-binding Zn-ribbon protein involved in translation (DUF1610 family)